MIDLWPGSQMVTRIVLSRCRGIPDAFGQNYPYLSHLVVMAGAGNYVETGARFGFSACVAALTKKTVGTPGKVYTIDPLIEGARPEGQPEVGPQACPGPERLERNAASLGVEVALIRKLSDPWPEELESEEFAVAYIDGNHWDGGPLRDFENLKDRVTHYIAFDNYEDEFPAVRDAVHKAAVEPGWRLHLKVGPLAVVTRLPDERMVWR